MMPTTSVNVFICHVPASLPSTEPLPEREQQLSYFRVNGSADPAHSSARTPLSEEEFLRLLDLTERAEGSTLDSHASGAGGGAYSLVVEGEIFADGCFGEYLQDRLTLIGSFPPAVSARVCVLFPRLSLHFRLTSIDTRGDGDVRAGGGASSGAAEERELFDAVVCVMDAQRLGAEGDAQNCTCSLSLF